MLLWATAILLATALLTISGLAAETLEEKVEKLEARKVPLHFEVKPAEGGKKNLELYYYEENERKPKDLVELLPFDISAFIERRLAKQSDKLYVDFGSVDDRPIVTARIRPSSFIRRVGKKRHYTIPIHQAGGIGYVRLSEARKIEGGSDVSIALPRAGSEEEAEKLYYVRVPIKLFPELDSEALGEKAGLGRFLGYTVHTCHTSVCDRLTAHNTFSCLVLNYGVDYLATCGTRDKLLATPLYKNKGSKDEVVDSIGNHSITAKEVAEIQQAWRISFFVADPKLVIDSHVQYVVLVGLQPPEQFNRMEPQFVEKYGQLVAGRKPTKKPSRTSLLEEVELVFEKDGKENRVAFPLRPCILARNSSALGYYYCLRTDEAMGEKSYGKSVTYAYKLH